MQVYITLDKDIAGQIAAALEMKLTDYPEQADMALIFLSALNPDMIPVINKPVHTGVIAGPYTPANLSMSRELTHKGVPPENIIFTPTTQINAPIIQELVTRIRPAAAQQRTQPRTIGIVSCKGGVGKTTIAAALVNHFNGFNQPAILIDWCTPPNGRFHTDLVMENQNIDLLSEDLSGYMRIVVDVPSEYNQDYSIFDCLIAVTSADMIQSVQPLKEIPADIIVYNRIRKEVPPEIIKQALGKELTSIEDDFLGCQAGLAKRVSANVTSQALASGIGKIASVIDEGRINNAENIRSRSA